MITETRNRIVDFITLKKQARVHDLVREFNISHVAIHKQLKRLVTGGILKKIGKPPIVFYVLSNKNNVTPANLSEDLVKIIDQNYLYVSPKGELLYGFNGFSAWVKEIKLEKQLISLAVEYKQTVEKAKKYLMPQGWIDATEKLNATFKEVYVDKLLYRDFYSLPKFGKTILGQLVLYAKQSQNVEFISNIAGQVKPLLDKIISFFEIKNVVYIPASIPRKVQFVKEFKKELALDLTEIVLNKAYPGKVIVAQKTLSNLEERITNAKETIFIKELKSREGNILLIDDAVGSGATFNETAKKLREQGVTKGKIVAFAIVGSFKGFDVIREV